MTVPLSKRSPARFVARMLAGATAADHAGFIHPSLSLLKDKVPAGPKWLHELKFDGYRAQFHVDVNAAGIFTRCVTTGPKRSRPLPQRALFWLSIKPSSTGKLCLRIDARSPDTL